MSKHASDRPRRTASFRCRVAPVATAAVVILVAGCGAAKPTSTRVATDQSTAQHVSALANRDRARQEADRLLRLAKLPPGAVRQAAPPQHLGLPLARPAVASQVDRTAYWRVEMSFSAALAWLRAHPPAGLRHEGSMRGSGRTYRLGGDMYAASSRPGIRRPQLQFKVASTKDGTAAIRVDALVIWLDPSPVLDRMQGPRLRLTVSGGCPASAAGQVGVRSSGADLASELLPPGRPLAALLCRYSGLNDRPVDHLVAERRLDATAAADLAIRIRRLDLSHPIDATTACPAGSGHTIALAVSYRGRPDIDLWYPGTGCPLIGNGVIIADAWTLHDAIRAAAGS